MTVPDTAFILAAGLGTRLRPYTDHCPKPLVLLNGRPIIDHVIDRLIEAGVTRIVVNLHYMADILRTHLEPRSDVDILFSQEETLLDTGGGIKKALSLLGDKPFFVVSGDSVWENGPQNALRTLARRWNSDEMDLLLLLQPLGRMRLTPGKGDYFLTKDGRAHRSSDKSGEFMWSSIRICTSSLFDNTPANAFSFLMLLDKAEANGRLFAEVHDGEWYHITTTEDLDRVNAAFAIGIAHD